MSDGEIVLLLCAGFVYGLFLVRKGFKLHRQRKLMRDTPTSTVRSLSLGPVELAGTVQPTEDTCPAPVTGRESVLFKYKVEEWDSEDTEWDTIDAGVEGTPFYVEDDTGRVLVDPKNATLDISEGNTVRRKVRPNGNPPEPIEDFVARNSDVSPQTTTFDLKITEVNTGRKRRYTEERLEPNDTAYVFGTATQAHTPDAPQGLVVKDGERDMFFISDKDEQELTTQRRWALLWRVPAGALLSAGCLGVLLWMFGVF